MTRTAYLVSQYPKLSHTFIEREIRALRGLGVEVQTFSVRPAAAADLLTETDRDEADATFSLLASKAAIGQAFLTLARQHPRAVLAGLRLALTTGPPTLRARLWQLFYLAEAALLLTKLRETSTRHVHVHLANNGADVARLAVAMGSRTDSHDWTWSFSMHGPTEFYNVDHYDLAAKVRSASFVACISDFCRSQLMMLVEPEHWAKLSVVHMSVEIDRYPLLTADRLDRSGPLRVLFVGRLTPEKAPQLLIDAVSRLTASTIELRIIGGGDEQTSLERQVRALGLDATVKILGPRGQEELLDHYRWADVFCLPSFAEGVPVVLMEALATGLPVVSTRIAGISELVEDGVSGTLIPPGRTDLVADALASFAGRPELREQYGKAGRAKVEADFTPTANAAKLRLLLDHQT